MFANDKGGQESAYLSLPFYFAAAAKLIGLAISEVASVKGQKQRTTSVC